MAFFLRVLVGVGIGIIAIWQSLGVSPPRPQRDEEQTAYRP
ncbi:MAG: hypothetical protein ACO2O0_01485 [Desulfurococcales archaeon]